MGTTTSIHNAAKMNIPYRTGCLPRMRMGVCLFCLNHRRFSGWHFFDASNLAWATFLEKICFQLDRRQELLHLGGERQTLPQISNCGSNVAAGFKGKTAVLQIKPRRLAFNGIAPIFERVVACKCCLGDRGIT
ncbi:hypothetical protein RXV86_12090 [Alisedimentitalea sp. MJ-SS2]|uniref:hypothetical protein n=1 Tax=Aliisedimentitalea sp. MJ-SS2 TaxID=3049795 RepID=UPI0029106E4D|nr:hypothetical protein [Alisedimentitalea sp. MJ-SS2]MDU8928128.1 hypothetical protein [Alisedimentitalea sp. MJ-SS2]